MSMRHPSNETLAGFVEFALSPALMREVDSHLDGCPACMKRHDEMARNLFFIETEFTLRNLTAVESQIRARQALRDAASRWGDRFIEWARKAGSAFIPDWEPQWQSAYRGTAGAMLVLNSQKPAAVIQILHGPPGAKLRIHGNKSTAGKLILLARLEPDGGCTIEHRTAGARSPHASFDVEPGQYLVLLEPTS